MALSDPFSPSALHPKFFAIPAGIFFVLAVFRVDNVIGAVLALFSCLLIMLTKAGMEFSADNQSFREYYSLLGQRFGQWELLPPIVGVTVKYFSEMERGGSSRYSWGIWNNAPRSHGMLIVMLSVKNKSTGIIIAKFSIDDVNSTVDFAHVVAGNFSVPVNTFLPADLFNPL